MDHSLAGQIKPEKSLFRYPNGKGPSDYSEEDFVPKFYSPNDVIDDSVLEICGTDTRCAFDYALTGNEDIAAATKGARNSYERAVESSTIGKIQV